MKKISQRAYANIPSGFLQKKIFYLLIFESIFCSLFMSTCGLPSMSGLCKLLSDCANLVKGQCTDKSGMT